MEKASQMIKETTCFFSKAFFLKKGLLKAIFTVCTIALIAAMIVMPASAATITVCPSGCDHTSIKAAVDSASSGDTVFVYSGTYNAESLAIKKPNITLKGEGADVVTIVFDGVHGIEIATSSFPAPGAVVDGFTIKNSPLGVCVRYGDDAPNCIIRNCVFDGITGDSGICIRDINTTFENNVVLNATGVYCAVSVESGDCTIVNNTFINNTGAGLSLADFGSGCENNLVAKNKFISNDYAGIELYNDAGALENNKIYLNNFIDNGVTATTSGTTAPAVTYWNSTEKIEYTYGVETGECYMGNYWKGYSDGESAECPGIWDTAYVVPDSLGNDYRPLMGGYENYFEEAEPTPTPTPTPGPGPVGVPEFNAMGLVALIGVLSVVLAVTAVGSKRKRREQ